MPTDEQIPQAILDALDDTARAKGIEPLADEVRAGTVNAATAATAAVALVRRGFGSMLAAKRPTLDGASDLARACLVLDALAERAATGRIVDLETTLGIWDELPKV